MTAAGTVHRQYQHRYCQTKVSEQIQMLAHIDLQTTLQSFGVVLNSKKQITEEHIALPDLAIIAASPTDFKQMVLPPVFGPVMTTTLVPLTI